MDPYDDSIAEGEDEVSDNETDSEQDVSESEELNLIWTDDYIIMEKTVRNGKNLLLLEMSGLGVKILFHICQVPFVKQKRQELPLMLGTVHLVVLLNL
ncbi:hypothetical protein JTB14_012698 [Gonioctena quinquepunctata]|nr:hypothetical protein JTB14_012698 [Gonioctena quinquepunctata]